MVRCHWHQYDPGCSRIMDTNTILGSRTGHSYQKDLLWQATQITNTNMTSCSGKDYRSPPGSSCSESLRHTLGLQWLHAGGQPEDLELALFSNNVSLRRASLLHISLSLVPADPASHQSPPAFAACRLNSSSKRFRIIPPHHISFQLCDTTF